MQDGIYHVKFSSPQGTSGEGLVVVKGASVNGGDASHLYLGTLLADGDKVSGHLDVKRWNNSAPSIFGPLGNFRLELSGTINPAADGLSVSGNVTGQPGLKINVTGRRISEAA